MTRRLATLDRLAGLVLGLVLLVVGLLAVDWDLGRVVDLPTSIDASAVRDVVEAGWFAWVLAVVGVVLGLLGLRWLLAHLVRATVGSVRLPASNETGRLEVDLSSLAGAAAARLELLAPVTDAHGTPRGLRGRTVVELRARVEAHADVEVLLDAVTRVSAEVESALPGTATCRVLLSAPRGRRTPRADRVRVAG